MVHGPISCPTKRWTHLRHILLVALVAVIENIVSCYLSLGLCKVYATSRLSNEHSSNDMVSVKSLVANLLITVLSERGISFKNKVAGENKNIFF